MKKEEQQEQEEILNEEETVDMQEETKEEIDPTESLKEEVLSLKDQLLRSYAEADNIRKRGQKQVEDARKFAVEKFATALLDVVDNLERALEVEEGKEDALREGVKLTLDSWQSTMSRFELKRIDAEGEQFDPHFHEALSKMPNDAEEGMVIAQHVAGYTLNGRLIRSAKVLVSSGPAE